MVTLAEDLRLVLDRVAFSRELHPGQREVAESRARFRVVACGRQWGKTYLATRVALARALKGGAVWWVAPDFALASIGWDEIKKLCVGSIPGAHLRESVRRISMPGGGWLQVKSAHGEGSLRGVALDMVVVDEAAFIEENRWYAELQPTLAVKGGEALFISTFNGENWFYDLYELGQDPNERDWASWRKPSQENPHLGPEEIERARRMTPRDFFEQEYLANPLVYVGAVFDGEKVQAAVERGRLAPEYGDVHVRRFGGVDWGYASPTVLEVCEEHEGSSRVRWIDEKVWQGEHINTRVAQIVEKVIEHRIETLYCDAEDASANRSLFSALRDARLPTRLIKVPFGRRPRPHEETLKRSGITTRQWYLENDLEDITPNCPQLIRDTKKYRYKEDSEDVEKVDDHSVDAATCFYSSRRAILQGV